MSKEINSTSCQKCGGNQIYKSTGNCVICSRAQCRDYYKQNKEKLKKKAVENYKANREAALARVRLYRNTYPERLAETNKKYSAKNRLTRAAAGRDWRKSNPDRVNYYSAARRAKLAKATPDWLSVADNKVILGYYSMAKRISKCLGYEHHVDHIYPLAGKHSCGLHVPWNLQVVPAIVNLHKNNKDPKEFYNE